MTQIELPDYLDEREIIESLQKHETMMKNLFAAYPSLLEKYPDQWVLWDGEDVVHATDTADELLRHISDSNIDTRHMKIEHLETNPRRLII